MPLTNAHTHLELGWLNEVCPDENGRDFLPWLIDLTERWNKMAGCYAQVLYHKAVESAIQSLHDAGVTHLTDISATAASMKPLLESGLQGVIYVELLGYHSTEIDRRLNMARYLVNEWRAQERGGMRIGLTLHTPFTVHPALWKRGLEFARAEALPLCIHVAESPAEYDWALHNRGPIADYLNDLMGMPFASPRKTPVQYLEDLGALELKPLLIHGVQVDEEDVKRIAASGSSVVHCPRSNQRLRCGRMPLELYLKHDVPVYLGTDSLASAPSLDIREEVEDAVALHDGIVSRESIEALVNKPLGI
ncbi:MAG: amidohydrolase family protein [Anaerolineae bacterium]|nr:amidohydrolase family protein [Anaerolineae bacterium]